MLANQDKNDIITLKSQLSHLQLDEHNQSELEKFLLAFASIYYMPDIHQENKLVLKVIDYFNYKELHLPFMYKNQSVNQQNVMKSDELFKTFQSQSNDSSSQFKYKYLSTFMMGFCYYHSYGTQLSYELAFKAFNDSNQQAGKEEYGVALDYIGYFSQYSLGTKCNYQKAIEYIEKGAKKNFSLAQNDLALSYLLDSDEKEKSFQLFQQSAENNNYSGQYRTAWNYIKGESTRKNYAKAAYYFKQSMNQGYQTAAEDYAKFCQLQVIPTKNQNKLFKLQKRCNKIHYQQEQDEQDFL